MDTQLAMSNKSARCVFHRAGVNYLEILCVLITFAPVFFALPKRQDTMCAYVRSFPMVEHVCVTDVGDEFGIQLFDSLCKATPTLCEVAIHLDSGCLLEWKGNAAREMD